MCVCVFNCLPQICKLDKHGRASASPTRLSAGQRNGNLRMEAKSTTAPVAGTGSSGPKKSGGMFAGMKGGFFKKKSQPAHRKPSSDEASSATSETHSNVGPGTTATANAGESNRQNDAEDDDDEEDDDTAYAHYRRHSDEGAYWAKPAESTLGKSDEGGSNDSDEDDDDDEEEGSMSFSGSESNSDSDAKDTLPAGAGAGPPNLPVPSMGDASEEADKGHTGSNVDASGTNEGGAEAEEEDGLSKDARAAARYMYLLNLGFTTDDAMDIAELHMDIPAYFEVSKGLSPVGGVVRCLTAMRGPVFN